MYRTLWIGSVAMMLLSAGVLNAAEEEQRAVGEIYQEDLDVLRKTLPAQQVLLAEPEELAAGQITFGDYWLGVGCQPARGALSTQLGLEEGLGLVVEHVIADSPAAKAGIQRHDVLVKAGETPLGELQELIDAVEAAKETELSIELFRGAQKQTVTVMPAKRPDEARPQGSVTLPRPEDWKKYYEFFSPDRRIEFSKDPRGFRIVTPGAIIVGKNLSLRSELPGNMSVSVTIGGDQPAKIVVERDDERWEVTEKELDKLPEDVRPHIKRMFGHGLSGMIGGRIHLPNFTASGEIQLPRKERREAAPKGEREGRIQKRLEKRLDEMQDRLEKLDKMFEQRQQEEPQVEETDEEA